MATYFHGGVRRLKVGDRILPPVNTVQHTAALNRTIAENPRAVGPDNCSGCGRFVWGADCGLVWDDYCGGWEADPWCKRCRAKRSSGRSRVGTT